MTGEEPIQVPTVYVVDDEAEVRRYLRTLLEIVPYRVEAFGNAGSFLDSFSCCGSCCLILDLNLPDTSGLELLKKLREKHIEIPVIIITGEADVPMAIECMKNGAYDFFEKPYDSKELLAAVARSIALHRHRQRLLETQQMVEERIAQLTTREREVLDLVVDGRLNKQIAAELGISAKTVEGHRARVMTKMKARSVPELVRLCILSKSSPEAPSWSALQAMLEEN